MKLGTLFVCCSSLFFITSCVLFQGQPSPSPCVIAPPSSITITNTKYAEVAAELNLLGSDIINGGIKASSSTSLDIIYDKIPDRAVACQMLLQLGACLADARESVTQDYYTLLDRKDSCGKSDTNTARNRGMYARIFIADETQIKKAKQIKVNLSDKGFLVPKISNMNGQVPNFNEVRYYYSRHFFDAKLVKKVLSFYDINDVLVKPLFSFPNKPIESEASLEIWLAKPTEN